MADVWVSLLHQPGADRDALRAAAVRAVAGQGALVRLCPHCGSPSHGRPRIAGRPDLHVSLAYADGLAALVVADVPVGVDVEADGTAPEGFPDRAAWTRAEAALKLSGEGLRCDPWAPVRDGVDVVALAGLPGGYVGSLATYSGRGGSSSS